MRPVKPQDAASLALWRRGSSGPEVLMGRRAARHRFMPDMFVFPGGRLDPGDFDRVIGDYRPEAAALLARHVNSRKAKALGAAALRETEEETGLKLDDLGGLEYIARAITPPRSPIRFHARFFVANAESAMGSLGGSGELLDLDFRPIGVALALPVADITEFILGEIDRVASDAQAERRALFWHYRRGKRVVSHD